jgi:hypothetical protein
LILICLGAGKQNESTYSRKDCEKDASKDYVKVPKDNWKDEEEEDEEARFGCFKGNPISPEYMNK